MFGENIKKARKQSGLTQKQLASKLECAEVSIRQYESNRREPSYETLQKISNVLNVPLYELMGYSLKHDTEANRAGAAAGFNATFGQNGAANVAEWEKVPFEQAAADQLKSRMQQAFSALNDRGQTVACERVEELGKIEDYQRTPPPVLTERPETQGGDADTPKQKEPSEGPCSPPDGTGEKGSTKQ